MILTMTMNTTNSSQYRKTCEQCHEEFDDGQTMIDRCLNCRILKNEPMNLAVPSVDGSPDNGADGDDDGGGVGDENGGGDEDDDEEDELNNHDDNDEENDDENKNKTLSIKVKDKKELLEEKENDEMDVTDDELEEQQQAMLSSHLTLEALQNIQNAMAQISSAAMGNPNSEIALKNLAVLQSTLFSLQHQRDLQMHFIKNLQSYLAMNHMTQIKDGDENNMGDEEDNEMDEDICDEKDEPELLEKPPVQKEKEIPVKPEIPVKTIRDIPMETSKPPVVSMELKENHPLSPQSLRSNSPNHQSTDAASKYNSMSYYNSPLASTIITNHEFPSSMDVPNSLEMLQKRAQEVLNSASHGLLAGNLADELAFRKDKSSSFDEKDGINNLKHRCRYCGKVFGSDSGLQIHIRSHTGERPFKCNVCGSRFTTKGNLKVHFQRHTAKFPYVQMNPNPIPEHLDKYYPPILSQSPSSSSSPPEPQKNPFYLPIPVPFPNEMAALSEKSVYRPSLEFLKAFSGYSPPYNMFKLPVPKPVDQDEPTDLTTKKKSDSPSPPTTPTNQQPQLQQISQPLQPTQPPVKSPTPPPPQPEQQLQEEPQPQPKQPQQIQEKPEDKIKEEPQDIDDDDDVTDEVEEEEKQQNILELRSDSITKMDIEVPPQPKEIHENKIVHTSPKPMSSTFEKEKLLHHHHNLRHGDEPENLTSKELLPHHHLTSPINHPTATESPKQQNNSHDPAMIPAGLMKNPMLFPPLLGPRPGFIDHSWENLIEITNSSETTKLQQLVDNIEDKLIDPNQCVVCHRVLSCKSALQMHYRIHTGEKPFRCRICGRAFTTKGNLKTHISIHQIKPPIRTLPQCPICYKKFSNTLFLQQHIRIHTGEPTDLTLEQIEAAEIREFPSFPPGMRMNGMGMPMERLPGMSGFGETSSQKDSDMYDLDSDDDLQDDHASIKSDSTTATNDQIMRSPLPNSTASTTSEPKYLNKIDKSETPPSPRISQQSSPTLSETSQTALNLTSQSQSSAHSNSSGMPRYSSAMGMFPNFPFMHRGPSEMQNPFINNALMSLAHSVSPAGAINAMGMSGTRGNTTCNICLKTFPCHSALAIHYRSHTKERPFICTICDRGFSTKGNMKQHLLTHKIRDMPQNMFRSHNPSPEHHHYNSLNYKRSNSVDNHQIKMNGDHHEHNSQKNHHRSENRHHHHHNNNNSNNNNNNLDDQLFARRDTNSQPANLSFGRKLSESSNNDQQINNFENFEKNLKKNELKRPSSSPIDDLNVSKQSSRLNLFIRLSLPC